MTVGARLGSTSCRIAAMSASFPRPSTAGSNAASRRSFRARSTGFIVISPFLPLRLEQFAQTRAGAVEPRADRADRQLEGLSHALVRELLPCEEQKRLALVVRQRPDGIGHPREEQAGIERRRARAPVRPLGPPDPGAPPHPPGLGPPGLHQQIRAHPVQPRGPRGTPATEPLTPPQPLP